MTLSFFSSKCPDIQQEEWERRAIAAEERYNTLRQERNNALQEHEQAVAAFRRERSEWQETASQVHAEMEKMQAAHSRVSQLLRAAMGGCWC